MNVLNCDNQSALMLAALRNKLECVKLLLLEGAKVREKDKNGFGTLPLYILWQKSNVDVALNFIEDGCVSNALIINGLIVHFTGVQGDKGVS